MQPLHYRYSIILIIMLCGQVICAQVKDSLLSRQDTLALVKQLVKEQLQQTILQRTSYKKIEQTKIAALLKDSAAADTLGKLGMQQLQQV